MIDDFLRLKVREKAGSTASSRFDFQKDWSICKLLDHHKKQTDYLFIFDYHDDLIIMDAEENPSKISFYQVKGKKTGTWTIGALIKSELAKDKKSYLLSILGKLYDHKINFKENVGSLNFISNASFKVKLNSKKNQGVEDFLCLEQLCPTEKGKIIKKLKEEFSIDKIDDEFETISFLKVVDLSLNDSASHTTGILADFLSENYPQNKYNVPIIYKVLFDEVKRRSDYSKDIHDQKSLLENKAISKRTFLQMLDRVGIHIDYDQIWNNVHSALLKDGLAYSEIVAYKKQWEKLQLEKMTYNNDVFFNTLEEIKAIKLEMQNQGDITNMSLTQMIDTIYAKAISKLRNNVYDMLFLKAAIILVIHE